MGCIMSDIQLYIGDCLEVMKDIPEHSIDMILCDLPYGVTAMGWDCTIQVPQDIYDKHVYLKSGNSSFKRIVGNSRDSMVYESLYTKVRYGF